MSKPPTEKQRAAFMRNWGIRNLRALYALSFNVRGGRGDAIRALIDLELAERGALPTADHQASESIKRRAAYQAMIDKRFVLETDIPF